MKPNLRDKVYSLGQICPMIRLMILWLSAVALIASPAAAWATKPCPMMVLPGMAEMHHAPGSAINKNCEHKTSKACVDACAAMATVPAVALQPIAIAAPGFSKDRPTALPSVTLVAHSPSQPARPPRLIA